VVDRFEKRQEDLETVHHGAASVSCEATASRSFAGAYCQTLKVRVRCVGLATYKWIRLLIGRTIYCGRETDDVTGLVALLKEDAILSMPPIPSWYRGREAIRAILLAAPFGSGAQNQWRLYPTRANGLPAFVLYTASEAQSPYRAFGVQVLTLDDSRPMRQIAEVTIFHTSSFVTSFGFPLELPQ